MHDLIILIIITKQKLFSLQNALTVCCSVITIPDRENIKNIALALGACILATLHPTNARQPYLNTSSHHPLAAKMPNSRKIA